MLKGIIKKFPQYSHVLNSLSIYWKSYGGWSSFITSPYLHFSVLFSILTWNIWGNNAAKNAIKIAVNEKPAWYDLTIEVVPSMLGFTLAAMAILLTFGDDKFRSLMAGQDEDGKTSAFMGVNAIFCHFVVVQTVSLTIALFGFAWEIDKGVFAWLGYTCFIYSIMIAIAATLTVIRVASWYDYQKTLERKATSKNKNTPML